MLPFFVTSRSLVVLTEDVYYEINRGSLPWRYKLAYRIFSGHAARAATRILAISESSKKNVARLFKINPDRISVNHLGVDIVNHSHSEIREGGKYVLYVGQAFPRRHLKETILAFSQIASEFPEINFIAVGRDKYNPPQIIDLIKEENVKLGGERIRHYDYISESQLLSLYKNAICLVYVSSEEAFGLPPLEALGYGTPPVVTDSELTRELLGNNAIFVSCPDSPQEIANALRLAIKDGKRREEISKQGRLTIDRFTWQNHFLKFKKVVEDVINI
jgi:glycosyltransferase involved in cell wall biosynthesis